MLYAVIMAGGAGTRFWPASRANLPKQLLTLASERSILQSSIDRIRDLIPSERIMVVTNEILVEAISRQVPEVPRTSIIGEPCKRDTAPCVGLAAGLIMQRNPEATMVVMPSDHVILPTDQFHDAIQLAERLVDENPDAIVTFGIPPTYAAETFGYIERGRPVSPACRSSIAVFHVTSFHEKPARETAEKYLARGGFYWNSGIFVWRARTLWDALQRFEPEMSRHLSAIVQAYGKPDFDQVLRRHFEAIQGKSIDYAVMERHDHSLVMEVPFTWDDVGSWRSLTRLRGVDQDGNTVVGRHLGSNTRGCIVRTDDEHLVVTIGMEDCIVVHTPDATLVARKQDEESVRKVVEMLKQRGWTEYL